MADKFQNDKQMLDYFQNEWLYRHKHYWGLVLKLNAFNFTVSLLPFITSLFGVDIKLDRFPPVIFPVAGIVLAIVTYWIITDEAKKLSAVGKAKYRINESMDALYHYETYVPDKNNPKNKSSFKISVFCLIFQLIVSFITILFLLVI